MVRVGVLSRDRAVAGNAAVRLGWRPSVVAAQTDTEFSLHARKKVCSAGRRAHEKTNDTLVCERINDVILFYSVFSTHGTMYIPWKRSKQEQK